MWYTAHVRSWSTSIRSASCPSVYRGPFATLITQYLGTCILQSFVFPPHDTSNLPFKRSRLPNAHLSSPCLALCSTEQRYQNCKHYCRQRRPWLLNQVAAQKQALPCQELSATLRVLQPSLQHRIHQPHRANHRPSCLRRGTL